jgi:hypothetical protein
MSGEAVKLHGLYDFKESLLDPNVKNGAIIFNEKFKEAAIKLSDDWFFIEDSDTNPHEKELYRSVCKIAESENSPAQKAESIGQLSIEFNTVTNVSAGTEKSINILSVSQDATSVTPPTPKATKEEYMENESFGEF